MEYTIIVSPQQFELLRQVLQKEARSVAARIDRNPTLGAYDGPLLADLEVVSHALDRAREGYERPKEDKGSAAKK